MNIEKGISNNEIKEKKIMNIEQGILNDELKERKWILCLHPDYIIYYLSAQHCSLLVYMVSLQEEI